MVMNSLFIIISLFKRVHFSKFFKILYQMATVNDFELNPTPSSALTVLYTRCTCQSIWHQPRHVGTESLEQTTKDCVKWYICIHKGVKACAANRTVVVKDWPAKLDPVIPQNMSPLSPVPTITKPSMQGSVFSAMCTSQTWLKWSSSRRRTYEPALLNLLSNPSLHRF